MTGIWGGGGLIGLSPSPVGPILGGRHQNRVDFSVSKSRLSVWGKAPRHACWAWVQEPFVTANVNVEPAVHTASERILTLLELTIIKFK